MRNIKNVDGLKWLNLQKDGYVVRCWKEMQQFEKYHYSFFKVLKEDRDIEKGWFVFDKDVTFKNWELLDVFDDISLRAILYNFPVTYKFFIKVGHVEWFYYESYEEMLKNHFGDLLNMAYHT